MTAFVEVELVPVVAQDHAVFVRELQRAFSAGVAEAGASPDEPIPSEDDVDHSLQAPGAEALHVVVGGQRIGGIVVQIDDETQDNSLDFFFIHPEEHSRGAGQAAWRAVEQRYPATRTWETMTPYFERRNIHFYVNRCGFSIVEFFHPGHPDPHHPGHDDASGRDHEGDDHGGPDLMFRFLKVMKPPGGS